MNDTVTNFSTEQLRPYLIHVKERSDKLMNFFLAGYFFCGLALAPFYDTWFIALSIGCLNLLAYYATRALLPHSSLYQYVASGIMAVFMAQFIYQMHGLFEMHFFAFVGCTVLITYQNWRLQIPLILLIVIHHATFAYLQYAGMSDIYFTQVGFMSLSTFIIHALLAALIVFICGLWAYDLEKNTRQRAIGMLLLEQQLSNVRTNIAFAEEISRNNLTAPYQQVEGDELGKALLNMRESLLLAAEKERQEKFRNVGFTRMNEILRRHSGDLSDLSFEVIREAVRYLEANQGGMFLVQEEEDGRKYLELSGCYAYERRKYQRKRIESGEGLVGQALLEKDTLFLTDVPTDYVQITSGLGKATPRCIVVVPLKANEEIAGIIEIASFRPLNAYQVEFLEKAGEMIATALLSARVNEKTAFLLAQSKKMTEDLRVQEEVMRQNMEELQSTQEESQRKMTEYETLLRQKEREAEALKQQLSERQPRIE